jgi:hypothetical protein
MTEYVFDDNGKGRTFTVTTKRITSSPIKHKRIAKFVNGKFKTDNPKIFLKLKKAFPYTITPEKERVMTYNDMHRNMLVKEAAERGIKGMITKKKTEIIEALQADDAKKAVKK